MDIALSRTVSVEELSPILADQFPTQSIRVSEMLPPESWDAEADVLISLILSTIPGFPAGLSIERAPQTPEVLRKSIILLAKQISSRLAVLSICDGTGFGPDDSPYWFLIWIEGQAHLADDSPTDSEPPGPPQLIRTLEVPEDLH